MIAMQARRPPGGRRNAPSALERVGTGTSGLLLLLTFWAGARDALLLGAVTGATVAFAGTVAGWPAPGPAADGPGTAAAAGGLTAGGPTSSGGAVLVQDTPTQLCASRRCAPPGTAMDPSPRQLSAPPSPSLLSRVACCCGSAASSSSAHSSAAPSGRPRLPALMSLPHEQCPFGHLFL